MGNTELTLSQIESAVHVLQTLVVIVLVQLSQVDASGLNGVNQTAETSSILPGSSEILDVDSLGVQHGVGPLEKSALGGSVGLVTVLGTGDLVLQNESPDHCVAAQR